MPSPRRVISLNLRRTNEDESKALAIIEEWEAKGFDAKQILIPYILKMNGLEIATPEYMQFQINDFLVTLSEFKDIVNELKQAGVRPPQAPTETTEPSSKNISINDPLAQSLVKRRRKHN